MQLPNMTKLFSTLLLTVVLGTTTAGSFAAPKIKCWTNKEGIRECGNSVPPEYAQKGHVEVNERGRVIDTVDPKKTKEQLAEEVQQKELEKERKRQAQEQANQDRALLNTYSNTDDMQLARDGKIRNVDTSIKLARSKIENMQKQLDDMKKSAANMERSGKPVSKLLKNDMDETMNRINNNHELIKTKQQERKDIYAKFEADITRFNQLKGITPTPSDGKAQAGGNH